MDWLLTPSTTGGKLLVMALAIVAFVVVMGLILFLVDRPKRIPGWLVAAAFAGPALILVTVGLVYPGILTVINSFKDKTGRTWVGLDNYAQTFGTSDLQLVLRNTALWVILVPIIATVIGLIYAVLVDRTRFEKLAKALVFLPMAISMVGASIIWKFVYEFKPNQPGVKQTGLLNQVIVWLGGEPQQFLSTQPWNTFFLIVVMIWIQTGFAMTVLSASIKAIPDDIIEAARLDGLKGIGMFRYITVPSIRPALVVVITTIAMGTLKVFDVVRTMTGGQFGTSVVANEFYTQQFRQANQGLAAALAVILFVLVIPIVIYNVGQMRKVEEIR
ncbi:carbohydrate ABC transporter membrane protein 1 (CUT1 family) [Salana multivorans]|uniref:Carbohydrate ABC transporter membrane protein 1 (CUT1 family) n=1 Tax=Salana multivorans TaxID=120377 RepID=A0A3N2DAX1_9MICO|nr:sugar ABC transporter permease [Salana multivorans]MBN8882345.1 sugar ABC transporter permease [Salana multivorans]OJX96165.1 MAG: ABC transporter permease [Micrococcales bacterium 73-15]ROR96949.1 carbohydrate ABC transporter membrane protein 1 (CUT1 family) [Salana multivorans]